MDSGDIMGLSSQLSAPVVVTKMRYSVILSDEGLDFEEGTSVLCPQTTQAPAQH